MKLGFIGMGNMATAIASGFLSKGLIRHDEVFAYAPNQEKLKKNGEKIGFVPVDSLEKLVDTCEVIFLACKPYQLEGVFDSIGEKLSGKEIVSIAAGWDFKRLSGCLKNSGIQAVMPNTPAMVGEGVFLFEKDYSISEDTRNYLIAMFQGLGAVLQLPGELMGIGGAISGCGPAFMDICMEAYADAAVKYGISREDAYKMVAKTMIGTAKLMLETGKHPGELKDQVCSPNGTTICGVAALEEYGFRNACIKSIDAIMEKKKTM